MSLGIVLNILKVSFFKLQTETTKDLDMIDVNPKIMITYANECLEKKLMFIKIIM